MKEEMHLCQVSVASTLLSCIFFCYYLVNSAVSPAPAYLVDVAVNCGSSGNSTALDGRKWIGDSSSAQLSLLQVKGNSRSSIAVDKFLSADPIPYKTVRISPYEFYYTFPVSPGQIFIRLHFFPTSYHDFEKSEDFFTVKAGPFTLLRNFSASLAAEFLDANYIVKEFCLNVQEHGELNITFFPTQTGKSKRKLHAFVNGIEVISMPAGLYYTPDGSVGVPVVGQNYLVHIDGSTALELVERLNTGGSSISSIEDFGMFRRWNEDTKYLLESPDIHPSNKAHVTKYANMLPHIAPLKLCQTFWKTGRVTPESEMYEFTWKIPVDLGFGYLVRLHFCDFDPGMIESGQPEFNVLISIQIAETEADVIRWSGGNEMPVYKDCLVMMKGDKEEGKRNLSLVLQSADELALGLLKGLEIFKLSNPDNSLASPNLAFPKPVSTTWMPKIRKLWLALGRSNTVATSITILITLLNVIVYSMRQIWENQKNFPEKDTESASNEPSYRCFSLAAVKLATQNFSDAFVVGRGGFGKVYKGFISGVPNAVAIKRLNSNSRQGAHEFWTEIETLSKLRHIHLVPLIGYCNECQEMILVYEYMPLGTLADNLYKISRDGKDFVPLSWEQRLRICIGAARGLDYLHTGSEYGVIHRDVKDSNILLDENLVAKISDFGLSKLEKISESKSYVSTKVKGTFGYLDPDYFMTHRLTRKSDVYAFGVVLLVVLCGRPAVDNRVHVERQSLLSCFRECISKGEIDEILDPNLQGKISSQSLREFAKCIEICLQHRPQKRPTMAQVVASLEYALEQQASPTFSAPEQAIIFNQLFSKPDEAVVLGHPHETEMNESFQHEPESFRLPQILEESVISPPPEEGVTSKPTRRKMLQSRKKYDNSIQKPFWVWPWAALWNRGKPLKEKDLFSQDGTCLRFSMTDIRAATLNFSHDCVILNDDFKMAYRGYMEHLQMEVLIFKFNAKVHDKEVVELHNDIEILSQLRHPNLLPLIGYCYHENEMFILYDYVGSNTLHNCLHVQQTNFLSWKNKLQICIALARGIDYLHNGTEQKIIHGDVRPENVLLDENFAPKISNFGLYNLGPTGRLAEATTMLQLSCLEYMSPNVIIRGPKLTEKSDVYSFGLMLLEVLCCRKPFSFLPNVRRDDWDLISFVKRRIRNQTLHQLIDSNMRGEIATACLAQVLKIAFSCLLLQATKRPTIGYVGDRLEFALELQENAETAKHNGTHDDRGFNLEDVYQEITNVEHDDSLPVPDDHGDSQITDDHGDSQITDELSPR